MKFIDEASIYVEAGKGGNGCLSFLREKYRAKGGPDGGDGGDGGSIYLRATEELNTLVDFRYQPRYKAGTGEGGRGRNCSGAGAPDLVLDVPVGTTVIDQDTQEILADMVDPGVKVMVAKGGFHGIGNARFKSSVNRAPRQTTKGTPGEERHLKLELKILADVGLLGVPNAGKSTFIRSVSAAKPKVADYPFTTLVPNLGVVSIEAGRSFVIADIPGLIEGASEGAGLGFQFLRHVARTNLLLHIVDMAPFDESDPVEVFKGISRELEKFSPTLARRDRWLVLNKLDLIPEAERQQKCDDVVDRLKWDGPVFPVSAIQKDGTDKLCQAIMIHLEEQRSRLADDPEYAEQQKQLADKLDIEVRGRIAEYEELRRKIRQERKDKKNAEDDNFGVDVFYEP